MQRSFGGPGVAAPSHARPARADLRRAAIAAVVFVVSLILARRPQLFDLPVMRVINGLAGRSRLVDAVFYDLDRYASFSGVLLTAVACGCWFATSRADSRARILVGVLLAFPIGVVSRLLQHLLVTHPRPFLDSALGFRAPTYFSPPFTTWNSFPSDHATVFGALLLVIWTAAPRVGWALAPWFLLVEFARSYMGAHYPSDILGGVALGMTGIWLAAPWMVGLGRRALRLERAAPGLFYAVAFFVAYQVATLFFDFRDIVGGLR